MGLCLAAVTTPHTSVAFHLHTAPRGTVAAGSGGCDHAAARRSATCRLAMQQRRSRGERSAEVDNGDNNGSGRREGGGAAKDLSALLLSAMLLGNPQLSDAAAVTQAAGGASTVDPTVQGRLIADLEKRLMSMPTGDSDAAAAPVPAAASPAPAARAGAAAPQKAAAGAGAADVEDAAARIQPMFVPPTATPQTQAAPAAAAAASSAAAATTAEAPAAPAAPAPTQASSPAAGGGGGSSKSKEPLIKMKDYSFSIKLPELNLPPVAPITVPEEGNPFAGMRSPTAVFRAPSEERVAAQPDLPGAGVVREALQSVARGEGVKDLAHALAAAAPKQADYNR